MAQQIDIGIITIRDDEHRVVLNTVPEEPGEGRHDLDGATAPIVSRLTQ